MVISSGHKTLQNTCEVKGKKVAEQYVKDDYTNLKCT